MFQINVQVDTVRLFDRMDKGVKRLPYAVSKALRFLALDVQAAAHENVRRMAIVRKPDFLFGSPGRPGGAAGKIVVFPNPGQGVMYAEVAVGQGKIGTTPRLLLPIFEAGGERRPFTPGAKSVAVPLQGRPARPTIRRGVPPQFTFAGLAFKAFRKGSKAAIPRRTTRTGALSVFDEFGRRRDLSSFGKVQWKGKERTFILDHSALAPRGGVFQRIGPKRGDIRELYSFEPPMHLPAKLHFYDTARRVVAARWKEHMERATIDALAHSQLYA